MSAMQAIDHIREQGGRLTGFASYCGGLVAPDSDDNPWRYKLSWNPRNVVLAGQGGSATFLQNGRIRVVPPHRTFQTLRPIQVEGRAYDGYPNRDSLGYRELYGLEDVETLVRGTLRGAGFCSSWDILVQLGMVRDDAHLTWRPDVSWAEWTRSFLPAHASKGTTVREAVAEATQASGDDLDRLEWLGLFDERTGPVNPEGTPAQIIEALVTHKWVLNPEDRDMIVMWHRFDYERHGERKAMTSSLCLEGKDNVFTAMSDTVGLPMALAVKPMLEGAFGTKGVDVPMSRTYYEPLLNGLAKLGIHFVETHLDEAP
jgi:saccharopine dehydrogenase (NADP+, L-glutamate forming)